MGAPLDDLGGVCRDDLLSLDGQAIGIRLEATADELLDRQPAGVRTCDPEAPAGSGTADDERPTIELGPERPCRCAAAPAWSVGVDLDEPGSPGRRGRRWPPRPSHWAAPI